jgi:hypothetical protein
MHSPLEIVTFAKCHALPLKLFHVMLRGESFIPAPRPVSLPSDDFLKSFQTQFLPKLQIEFTEHGAKMYPGQVLRLLVRSYC